MATIALDNLKPQDPLKLQTLPQDTTDYASIINSAVGNPMELDKQVQGQETQVQSSLNTLSNLMQEGAGIGSQQLAMENQAGISQQQKEVQDLTNQLNAIKTQANVIPLQIQQESAGRGRTEAGVAPLQTAELRNNAIQALTVGAQLQAKQGNLALAQSQIDRAIELKYRDIENRTKLAELNYNRNKETLERIDKKRADALGYAIQKQKEKDAENKANEIALETMLTKAYAQGAPKELVDKARTAKTPLEAVTTLGQWGGDYWAVEKAKADALKAKQSIPKVGTGVSTTGGYVLGSDKEAEAWATRIANKQAKLSEVPSAMRTRVVMAMGGSPETTAKATELQSEIKTILGRMQGYKNVAIGAKAQLFPVASQIDLPLGGTNQTAAALADAERLSALLTTENIALMKGLGSMSNIEFGNIEKIGSSIIGRDKDGNAYFKGDRANYDREIKRLLGDISKVPELEQMRSEAPQIQSKWSQGDVQNTPSPLSDMANKGHIKPNSPFGTIEFNLPTKP